MGDRDEFRVVIGTRPPLFRELLGRALAAEPGILVVGAGDSEDALDEVIAKTRPQLLLFDYEALGPNSEGTIHRLLRARPGLRILVFATRSGPETVQGVLHAGASGLVGKAQSFATLVRALRSVAAGELWADRLATAHAFERLARAPGKSGTATTLTRREADIVAEVVRGLRNKEIAHRLRISEKTVKAHLNTIFRKLGVSNRMALALLSVEPKS